MPFQNEKRRARLHGNPCGGAAVRLEAPSVAEAAAFNLMDNACLNPAKLEVLGWQAEVVFRSADSRCGRTQIPREELWRTQTPHTYTLEKLLWAHAKSAELGLEKTAATCQLMALLGEAVYFSKGSEKNLKLTTIDDIDIFKALLNTTRSAWQNS